LQARCQGFESPRLHFHISRPRKKLRTCQHGSEACRQDCKTDTPDTKPAVSPQPTGTRYRTELHFDANRNVIREDIEDKLVRYQSEDPSDAGYGHFSPTGSHSTANVPMRKGHAGRQLRPGWFSNLRAYDLLDNLIEEDEDATGSHPDHLITRYQYDPNENLIQIIQPEGNRSGLPLISVPGLMRVQGESLVPQCAAGGRA
jgi:YD repeat-containing protein